MSADLRTEMLARCEAFVVERVLPSAEAMDRSGEVDLELLREAAGLGFARLLFDDNLELDLSNMSLAHEVTERIASASPTLAIELGVMRLTTYLLARFAPDELKKRWIEPTIKGDAFGSFAITELNAGTDVRAGTTIARREGDHYTLTGTKSWVGFAPHASYAIVLAKLESTERDAKTVALVVDMSSEGASGEQGPELSAFRGLSNGTLNFDNVIVPASHALNVEGFAGMMDGLSMARIDASSYACGILRSALEVSVERASTRVAFGKVIGELPSIQIKLGRMRAAYHAARALTLQAGESFAAGNGGDQDAISMAKMTASDFAREHTDQAMQIFGADGMRAHSRVERMHRDAKATQIFDGTSEIHETMLGRRVVRAFVKDGYHSYLPAPRP